VIIHKHKLGKFGNIQNMKVNFFYYKAAFHVASKQIVAICDNFGDFLILKILFSWRNVL
jgi:hypothetical protein